MTHRNIKYCRGLPITVLALAIGSAVPFTTYTIPSQFDITFTTRILAMACDIAVNDGTAGGATTVYIGDANHKAALGDLINEQNSTATPGPTIAAFNIKTSGRPASLQNIKTTITGAQNGNKVLVPSNISDGDAKSVGVKIARANAPDQPFTIFASTTASTDDPEVILWDAASEVGDGKQLDLIVHLIPTSTTTVGLTTGRFSAIATSNFNYE